MINKINGLLPVGGEIFVVLPLLCLVQSQFINRKVRGKRKEQHIVLLYGNVVLTNAGMQSYENIWIKLGYELKEIRVTPKLHMIWGVKRREGDGEGKGESKTKRNVWALHQHIATSILIRRFARFDNKLHRVEGGKGKSRREEYFRNTVRKQQ